MRITLLWIPLVVLLFIWYLTFSANRLDRLHHRAETSWANLDAILQRRAALAIDIAHLPAIDPATNLLLTAAAHQARDADIQERSEAESGLTGALLLLRTEEEVVNTYPEIFDELDALTERLRIAIALHVEAVTAARTRREKFIYRAFKLAGHAPLPVKYAFEDDSLLEPQR
jgi:type II secretory pathway component PulM